MPLIEGYVRDRNTGKGIPYAVVKLNGYTTATDATGYFSIVVPAGIYTLSIRHAMYRPFSETIKIETNISRDFYLERMIL